MFGRLPHAAEMLATLVAEPFHRGGWIYEEKVDGWRIVAHKDGTHVWLVSRTGRDHARRFPEIAEVVRHLPAPTLILDGEIARFDKQLVSRFHLLHEETGELATPPVFVAFDCLWRRGRDLRGLTLGERRQVLEGEIGDGPWILPARRLDADGLKAWQQVPDHWYEGLVAKDERSIYVSGPTTS